jgi:hypothetical protein
MQITTRLVLLLAAADKKLILLLRDLDLVLTALDTLSRARSISSKPSRNGEFNAATRTIFEALSALHRQSLRARSASPAFIPDPKSLYRALRSALIW